MGSFFLCLPLVVVVLLLFGSGGGVAGACTRICIDNPSILGGRDGVGTIVGG
jgi:hypothetical protein